MRELTEDGDYKIVYEAPDTPIQQGYADALDVAKAEIATLRAELADLRSTRMNCSRDGICQHCGRSAVACYHPTVEEYAELKAENQRLRDDFDKTWAEKNAEIDKLREGLRKIQCQKTITMKNGLLAVEKVCVGCGGTETSGCKPDCRLAELLKEE